MEMVLSLYQALMQGKFTQIQAEANSNKFFLISTVRYDESKDNVNIECIRKGFTKKLSIGSDILHFFDVNPVGYIDVTCKYHATSKGVYSFQIK